jgi:hypothetical protein
MSRKVIFRRSRKDHERQVYSAGSNRPAGARVRNPVAWMARGKVTELWESIDKAIVRMGSESSGRNGSKGRGGLEMSSSSGRALG